MEEIFSKTNKNPVEPVELTLDSKFRFRCHKGISCFNKCCGDLEIFLTPADIARMKNRLKISSGEFLNNYTEPVVLEKTLLPIIKLRMKEDGKCRFVTEEGCEVYTDRPLACRYYPLGFGALQSREVEGGDFYFFVKEDHCNGFEEDKEWTVREWRDDQEISSYDDLNKEWVDIIIKKKLIGGNIKPDERSIKLFFTASYDIDSFKKFVFESRFFDLFDLSDQDVRALKDDESELLKFAHRWLKYVLFKEPTVALKTGA